MIPYIAHVSLLLAASYLFYKWLLSRETFYQLNRYYLISALIISMVVPLIVMPPSLSFRKPITLEVPSKTVITKTTTKETIAPPKRSYKSTPQEHKAVVEVAEIPWWQTMFQELNLSKVIMSIYLMGVIVFALTFLIQFIILMFKKRKLEFIQDGSYRIYELTDNSAPYSFMRWIFVNPAQYDFETFNQILEHEKIHVSQAHYLDKMIAEVALIFNWFNPFVWMHRKAINNNLEFLTDESMLNKGTDKQGYQMSLLKVSVPQHALNLTTNYNESFLSERIRMMNGKKSSAKSSWKYLLILPLIGLSMATLNAVKPLDQLSDTFTETKTTLRTTKEDANAKILAKANKQTNKQTNTKLINQSPSERNEVEKEARINANSDSQITDNQSVSNDNKKLLDQLEKEYRNGANTANTAYC